MSGILGGIVNALGAANQGSVIADQERVKSALQQAQITRQQQQDQIASAVRARQEQSALLQDRLHQAQIGDTEAQTKQREYEVAHPKPVAPVMGTPAWEHAKIREAQIGKQYGYHPEQREQFTSVPATGADGTTHLYRFNTHTGQYEDSGLGPKPSGSGSGGGASGAQVPVADMEARYKEIADAAGALGRGEWKMTPTMQTREGANYANTIDNAGGHPSVTHQLLSGGLNAVGAGGDDYPKYQALMNSTRALGDDVAKVFKGRQNEQSVLREVSLSQLTPDDYGNPQVVEQKLSRLQHIINLAKLNNPGQSDLSGGTVGSHQAAPAPGVHPLKAKYGLE